MLCTFYHPQKKAKAKTHTQALLLKSPARHHYLPKPRHTPPPTIPDSPPHPLGGADQTLLGTAITNRPLPSQTEASARESCV